MSTRVYAHFIGAGGAGMSGIALVLAARGVPVSGSDLKESRYARALVAAGVPMHIGHAAENVGDPEIVVVSSAIPERNPEMVAARERDIPVWPRARMLAHLAGDAKTIAVAGTHGKTSTSSMVAVMLRGMGLDPTFLIGGEVDGLATNAAHGGGEHYVVEADESDGSFIYLDPFIAVVTNVEADHLDHYSSLAEIEETFVEFMERTHADGVLVVCGDQPHLVDLAHRAGRRVVTYGADAACDVRFELIGREGIGSRFRVWAGDHTAEAVVAVPGMHMVSNACAALAVAYALELDLEQAAAALASYSGVRRRFDLVGVSAGVTVVDDYAHHPTEVAATLRAASGLGFRRLLVCFQPHRYSRTQAFAKDFGDAFGVADQVILMDVYSAGEAPIPGVSGKSLVDAVLSAHPRQRVAYLPHRADIVPYLCDRLGEGDLVMTMGAGDVTALGPEIVEELTRRDSAESGA